MIDIDELMRLREAATPGPWATAYRRRENGMYGKDVFSVENEKTIAKIAWYPKELGNGVTLSYRDANADYIVAACNAVPELVQRIEQLEKENVWLSRAAANNGWHGVRVSPKFIQKQARIAVEKEMDASASGDCQTSMPGSKKTK